MGKVYSLPTADLNAETALEVAKGHTFDSLLIIGWTKEGLYVGGTNMECRDVLWLLETVKSGLMQEE